MTTTRIEQLAALSDYLASRREAILVAWRKAARADPQQTTGRSLTIGQFLDHIPQILDAFELKLRSRPGGRAAQAATIDKKEEEVKHGLHRWQQGYRLKELMSECGNLQLCLFDELGRFAAAHSELDRETLEEAHRQLLGLINETISESAAQFQRMQQAEAAGHVGALKGALASVNEIERRRAALIHQAVHDLGNDVAGVSIAARLLGQTGVATAEREEFSTLLERGVQGLTGMLGELMELARLEAGQECRKTSGFDASVMIMELCDANQPFARDRGLFLEVDGPAGLPVEGDSDKTRRLLQNLLTNAIKYTERGGVSVGWGEEKENWWLMVKDTGPGLLSGPGAPLVAGLQEATASAKESDEKTAASQGDVSHVLPAPSGATAPAGRAHHQPSEGIGLSIVKRLCELLDASLEIASSGETGTTIRVVFPRSYASPAPA